MEMNLMKKINENSRIKAVIFDLDHTLFDRYETLRLVCHDFYAEKREWFSKDISEEKAAEIMIEGDARFIVDGWKPVLKFWMKKGLLALDKNGEPIAENQELFDFIWNYGFLKHAVKYPFANPMLDELREAGIIVGLITNASNEKGIIRQRAKLRLLDMENRFDNILISGEVGILKPCRTVFDIMKWRLGMKAENMLYVGDNPKNDVYGSRTAGYIPCWVRLRQEYGETSDSEYSVRDVSEIPSLVDRINSGEI